LTWYGPRLRARFGSTLHYGPYWPADGWAATHATYTMAGGDLSADFHMCVRGDGARRRGVHLRVCVCARAWCVCVCVCALAAFQCSARVRIIARALCVYVCARARLHGITERKVYACHVFAATG
jgi:hypothetical protein